MMPSNRPALWLPELVAIGASAGGVDAIGTVLEALPAGFPAAVAIVLHLPPDRHSLLPELFGARCALPVKEVEDKEFIVPGMVYIAAPDYHMLVEPDRSFALSQDDAVNFSRPSIDLLLESAASAYRERLLGIVLTGASADGAAGLARVRELGGQGWVQDPDSADAPEMPASAIAQAGADRIMDKLTLARALASMGKDPRKNGNSDRE
ncbi:chemotaxis protein CheB [Bordetella bronchialis]|uniref:protein-glutamate methylesterase n=1 Tax=Bordetella bronchialis TaxID=463025 RepID=A0A193FKX1_9BORD|nr:chemotaxis protein CheB [Bordetella bronchialis]ANN68407.1 chemotaxis protein CheB [Bordetella bronchialis]ANN73548.1 chemotaxis protein CheB [Bordetella bronchialis]